MDRYGLLSLKSHGGCRDQHGHMRIVIVFLSDSCSCKGCFSAGWVQEACAPTARACVVSSNRISPSPHLEHVQHVPDIPWNLEK